jgi:antitoxin component of RelBE/YafQ-DinJ toxin-antitoxin module
MDQIRVLIAHLTKCKFKEICEKNGQDMSKLIRLWIEKYIKEESKK